MGKNKTVAMEWLQSAQDDLDSISYLLQAEHLTNIVAFHSQQAIEKSLKALMEYHQLPFIKTHNIEKLYRYVERHVSIEINYDYLELINELYIESRYPGDMGLLPEGKPSIDDAKGFYEFALDVFNTVMKKIQ
jgi:HEPN domain-containing protein